MLLWHSIKTPAIKTETNSAFPSISKTISSFFVKCQKLPKAAEFFGVDLYFPKRLHSVLKCSTLIHWELLDWVVGQLCFELLNVLYYVLAHNSQHFLGPHRSLFANCSTEKYQINHCLHHLAETTYDQNVKLGDQYCGCLFFAALSLVFVLFTPSPPLATPASPEQEGYVWKNFERAG